jgi:hypothetical protein
MIAAVNRCATQRLKRDESANLNWPDLIDQVN